MIWKEKIQSKKNPFSFFLCPHSPIPSGQKLWYGIKCVGIVINMSLYLTMTSWSHWLFLSGNVHWIVINKETLYFKELTIILNFFCLHVPVVLWVHPPPPQISVSWCLFCKTCGQRSHVMFSLSCLRFIG